MQVLNKSSYQPFQYAGLLPDIRKQIIASSKTARGLGRRVRVRVGVGSGMARGSWRSAAPATKVVVLGNLWSTPARALRSGMRSGGRDSGLARR